MARNTTKNFQGAVRYMYANRFGFLTEIGITNPTANPGSTNVDHDFDNDKALTWSDTTDTISVPALAVDAQSVILVDKSAEKGCRGSQIFNLNANAGLATQAFFIADRATLITGIEEVHQTAGTDAGAVTAQVTHETGTQAAGTGTVIQTNSFNLKGTAKTVQNATLLAPDGSGAQAPALLLQAGDRLSIVFTGTLTTLAGVVLTVYTGPGLKEEVATFLANANALITTQGFALFNKDATITGVSMMYGTAGTDAGAVTLDITHETSTTAPGSGTTILSAAQTAKGAINTVFVQTLTSTLSQLSMAAGDRLSLKVTGATTALAGLIICVYFQDTSDVVGTSIPYYGQVEAIFALKANSSLSTQEFFIADRDYEVVDVSSVESTAGSGTIDIQIDKGTTAAGSGTSVLASTMAATGSANTVVVGTMNVSRRQRLMSQGDRLAVVFGGTLGTLAGVIVDVTLLPR